MDPIEAAIADLESLKLVEKGKIQEIATKYGVNRSTLSKRWRGKQGSRAEMYEDKRLLNDQQEKTLVEYIEGLHRRQLPPTHQIIRNFAKEICGKKLGKIWPYRFLKRHLDKLVTKFYFGIDRDRCRADSGYKYSLYFKLLKRKIEQYKIRLWLIYNMDEKGFLIGILSKIKRIFLKWRYKETKLKQMLQDGNREWITSIACICADGTALAPALIY